MTDQAKAAIQDASAPAAMCLYFGTPNECQNCGGSTKAIDPDTGEAGPFEGDARFCSEECCAESQEFARRASGPQVFTACRSCGLDNFEHTEGCDRA